MAAHDLSAETRTELESFVTDWLSDQRIPGAGLAVVENGRVVYADGFGARDLDTNAPATSETLYGVASVTKSFTALAVLQQVERSGLELSDPVSDHLPFYAELDDPPTVHELLSHSSGMPSDGASVVLLSRMAGVDPVEVPLSSEADLERHVAGSLPERAEGERFFYYNTGYTVLGKLVEELDGRPFADYVEEEVLAPIGMGRSRVSPEDLVALDDVMTPYRTENDERVEARFPVKGVGAAGGLVSSARDLAAYLSFQLEPDPGVVDPELLDRARTPHATRQTYLDGGEQGYGYGWMRRSLLGDDLVEHGGSLGVSTSYVGFLDDAGVGVALACNDSPEIHPQYVGPALLAILRGDDPAEATRFYGLREKAERVARSYESYRGLRTATVEPDDAGLTVTLETALGEETVAAQPESTDPDDLRYSVVAASGARVPLTFEPTDDGLDLFYQRWRLHQS